MSEKISHFQEIPEFHDTFIAAKEGRIDEFEAAMIPVETKTPPKNVLASKLGYLGSIGAGALASTILAGAVSFWVASGSSPIENQNNLTPNKPDSSLFQAGTNCSTDKKPTILVNPGKIDTSLGPVAITITGPNGDITSAAIFYTDPDTFNGPIIQGEQTDAVLKGDASATSTPIVIMDGFPHAVDPNKQVTIVEGAKHTVESRELAGKDDDSIALSRVTAQAVITPPTCK